ncbi:glyoxalase-like protein [Mycobacterium sp. E1386]|uniref:VOC family protein n=1 Tax=Mycobacterium sp. E1386 TaxID=1834126 RepID=UPI000800DFC4|nr:VOC family protein [Mycobacterium sp. E1386]OBI30469.1 glyoxalase-like protein [Mycobacterium sp. E1386]
MSSHRTTFNHVGMCVSDRQRSRRFYENVLGFQFWWELDPPDGPTAKLVQLPKPLGVHATYLVRDGFVLELMDYSKRQVHAGSERVMDQVGLTHISFSVSDLSGALAKVEEFGGAVVEETMTEAMAMVRDPDGQLLELLSDAWLSALPAQPRSDA